MGYPVHLTTNLSWIEE